MKPDLKWPQITDADKKRVLSCLDNATLWRNNGKYLFELEKEFANLHQTKHALAVTNGTHALEIALYSSGIDFGDEVIVPAFTFISSVTAILMRGAFPIPVDVNLDDYCIDVSKIENSITENTKAIMPVHIAGHACDMDAIQKIAKKYNLRIIEDCAHSHGSTYQDKMLGSIGDFGTFSFQAIKLMSAGEGGMVITNSQELWNKAYSFFNCGRLPNGPSYHHVSLSSNYRMPELSAALLIGQIENVSALNKVREEKISYLNTMLSSVKGLVPQKRKAYATEQGYSMYMFRYQKEHFNHIPREEFINYLIQYNIPAYPGYPVFYKTPLFENLYQQDCRHMGTLANKVDYDNFENPNTDTLSAELVWLPHFFLLNNDEILDHLIHIIKSFKSTVIVANAV